MSALADMDRAVQDNHDRERAKAESWSVAQEIGEHTYTHMVASCLSEPCVTWTRVRALLVEKP